MKSILGLNKNQLLALQPSDITWIFSAAELVYLIRTLEAFWSFDYEAATQGIFGLHAELKSGLHSDGFIISRIFLAYPNIRMILAQQIVWRMEESGIRKPKYIAGIPDGATGLGNDVRKLCGAKEAILEKVDGRLIMRTILDPSSDIGLIEDFSTRGTGLIEAVTDIYKKNPTVRFVPYVFEIINRGGLESINIPEFGDFKILPIANHRIEDWQPKECPLCMMGSKPIKPKATDENWRAITTSQLIAPIT